MSVTPNMANTRSSNNQRRLGGEDAVANGETNGRRSNFLSFMYLLKGFLGMGFFTVPFALLFNRDFGFSCVITIITYSVCIYFLVNTCQTLGGRLTYAETVEAACNSCPKTQKLSKAASITVQIFIFLSAFFLCSLYLGFITNHVERVVSYNKGEYVDYRMWLIILTIPLLALCVLPWLNAIAVIGVILELLTIIIFYGAFVVGDFPTDIGVRLDLYSDPLIRFVFSSILTFLMEGITIVLVVENKLKDPKRMSGCPSMLCAVMTFIGILNALCATLAFLRFGSMTRPFITLSTPSYTTLGQFTLLCAALSIYFTYPIQFDVGFNILWVVIEPHINQRAQKPVECIIRILLVLLTAAFAIIDPDFLTYQIILHGGFFFTFLGTIVPIFLQICVSYSNAPGYGQGYWRLIILVIGIILSIIFMLCVVPLTFYVYFDPKVYNVFEY